MTETALKNPHSHPQLGFQEVDRDAVANDQANAEDDGGVGIERVDDPGDDPDVEAASPPTSSSAARPTERRGQSGFDDAEGEFQEEDIEVQEINAPPLELPPLDGVEANHGTDSQGTTATTEGTRDGRDTGEDGASGTDMGFQRVVRRRLNCKTSPRMASSSQLNVPAGTSGGGELVTRVAAAAARVSFQRQLAEHRGKVKRARTEAWSAIFHEPSPIAALVCELHTEEARDAEGSSWGTHPSHDMTKPADADILYCRICGSWSRGRRVRGLAEACRGSTCNKGNLRLLEFGIAPVKGARLPPQFKKAGTRGTRGGAAIRGVKGRAKAPS